MTRAGYATDTAVTALVTRDTATIDVAAFVTFPRADASDDLVYRARYCAESRGAMAAWASREFDRLGNWPRNTGAGELWLIGRAHREIGRNCNENELALVERVVRDLLAARSVLRERDRLLAREVL